MRLTNPLWYLASFAIALAGVMLATVVAAGAWDPIREAQVTPTSERADAAGRTLAVFTDIVQSDRDIACRTVGRDKTVTPVPAATLDLTVDQEGDRWYLIGLLKAGSNDVKVGCAPVDRQSDNATYAYATVTGYTSKFTTGKGIAILSVTVGGLVGVATFVNRWRRRRSTQAPADPPTPLKVDSP